MGNDYDEDSSYLSPRGLCKGPPLPNFDKLLPYTQPLPIPSEFLPQVKNLKICSGIHILVLVEYKY